MCWYLNAQRLVDGAGLQHHRLAERAQCGITDHPIERGTRQGADWIEADIPPELQPYVPTNVVANGCIEARPDERFAESRDPRRAPSVRLPEREAVELEVSDDSGLHDLAGRI